MKLQEEKKLKAIELRKNGLSIIEIGKQLNCSKSSVYIWVKDVVLTESQKNKLRRKSNSTKSICKGCKQEFVKTRENRASIYCSKKCYYAACKLIPKQNKKVNKCKFCGNDCVKKFCCFKCSTEYNWQEKINKVLSTGMLPHTQSTAKSVLLKIRPHQCEICKQVVWNNLPIPLILDHINGKHNDCRIENVRLVCGNCDMQLPTYKSKNKGNGRYYDRTYRKKRYHEKKNNEDI